MRIITNCLPDGRIGPVQVIYLGSIVKYRVVKVTTGYVLIATDELGDEIPLTKTAFDTEALTLIGSMETQMENGEDEIDLRIGVTDIRG